MNSKGSSLIRILLVALIILGVIGGIFYVRTKGGFSSKSASTHAHQAKYHCPMHPDYVSDKPGDCPICHMKLVLMPTQEMDLAASKDDSKESCAVHECSMMKEGQSCPMLVISEKGEWMECPVCRQKIDEKKEQLSEAGYAAILLSPEKQQMIGVRKVDVAKRTMTKTLHVPGKIAYDPELYQAQIEYLKALKQVKYAPVQATWVKSLMESVRVKMVLMGLDQTMISQIAKQTIADKSLISLEPNGSAWIYANIFEYEIGLVKSGDKITIDAPSLSGKTLEGEIRAIDALVDPVTRTVKVRAVVQNQNGLLKSDMFVNVQLKTNLGDVLAVPEESVFLSGKRAFIFVDKGEGLFDPRPVVLGSLADGFYEVKSGALEGEKVLANGNFLVDSESKLKAALSQ